MLKVIIAIVVLILVLLIGYFIRNYIIISKVSRKNGGIDNYSLSAKYSSIDENQKEDFIIEQYYKEGKIFQILKNLNGDQILVSLYNEDNNEYMYVIPDTLSGGFYETETSIKLKPFLEYENNLKKIESAISSKISTEYVDGQKCYVISYSNKFKDIVSAEDGRILKRIDDFYVSEFKDVAFEKVKDSDVIIQNIEKYNLIEGRKIENGMK